MTDASFVALDVETANPDLCSVCQVGLVVFEDGDIRDAWSSLVNPEDYFHPWNVAIHGIDEDAVRDAPLFSEISDHVQNVLDGAITATHTPFDKVALTRACQRYEIDQFRCTWLDTARVCRRAWTQFARSGYGLANMASWCGIEFEHHDALEDARAAGLILLQAVDASGLGVADWVTRSQKAIDPSGSQGSRAARTGNPDGPLAGEVAVFTGALSMPRREAADLAAAAGCDVAGSVTKKTTLLVVGDQDLRKLAGHGKSAKHRRAEELIGRGCDIRILGERDFVTLVGDGAQSDL